MKSKKNRKQVNEKPQRKISCKKSGTGLFKVQFDVLKNDISCFINTNKASKTPSRKVCASFMIEKKISSIPKNQQKKTSISSNILEEKKNRGSSPDLIRQSSNTILTKIQEKGIGFDWKEEDQYINLGSEAKENEDNVSIWSAFNSSFQKSFASTNDFPMYQSNSIYWQNTSQMPMPVNNPNQILPQFICQDWRTTIMIRNIPNKYTITELAAQIDVQHSNTYDFLYLPCDLKNQCNVGYGFINFISTQHLRSFYLKFHHYIWKKYRSEKICSLAYARLQGLNQLIQHFQNSKVLNQKQKKYRPIIKYDQIQKMVLQQQKK